VAVRAGGAATGAAIGGAASTSNSNNSKWRRMLQLGRMPRSKFSGSNACGGTRRRCRLAATGEQRRPSGHAVEQMRMRLRVQLVAAVGAPRHADVQRDAGVMPGLQVEHGVAGIGDTP